MSTIMQENRATVAAEIMAIYEALDDGRKHQLAAEAGRLIEDQREAKA
jgi:hypothetical protein